jgi:hypothetical protein
MNMANARKDAKATAESLTSTTVLITGTRIPSVNKKQIYPLQIINKPSSTKSVQI